MIGTLLSALGLNWIPITIGVVVGAMLAGTTMYEVGHWKGDSAGYARFAAEQTKADLKAEKERKQNDSRIQNLSDYSFCVESLKRRGLPIDACDELRGIPAQ